MKTAGIIIGVLMVGGAVVALSNNASASNTTAVSGCTFPNATNYNPNATVDNGTCLFEKQEDSENYQQQKEEQREQEKEQQQQQQEQEELAEINCSGFKSQTSDGHSQFNLSTPYPGWKYRGMNHVWQLKAYVDTDKTKYLAGEPIKIYLYKTRLVDDGFNKTKWEKWGNATRVSSENLGIKIEVQSNDEVYKLFDGDGISSATTTNYNPLSGSSRDQYSVRVITINTNSLINIKEPVKFKITAKLDLNEKYDKSKTKESAFTVYPAGCSKTQDAESYSHDEEIMSFQSFVYPW